ncbi:hypothetical protein BU14_0058s0066 [Porphyra umbilicalis]|uniref:Uncharacterized protein n=1 Tax=Porphyra umbilicalis TaxID=2786 RepID=A0A1X6PH98_PORUM|nr:hypothetical protein BU14_0058s0066 [Porphyra umbilicalis]|eukprot:OSX80155.1 hypothetical protein BU14_0058s0066 [Porphyra umbilicalis]
MALRGGGVLRWVECVVGAGPGTGGGGLSLPGGVPVLCDLLLVLLFFFCSRQPSVL